MSNDEIVMWMHRNKVMKWQVANKVGICESNFSKWWRYPLTRDRKKAIIRAVEEIIAERKAADNG